MKNLSSTTKLVAVGLGVVLLQAVFDASREYFKADLTPTVGEWIRNVGIGALAAFLYWLRSPKDASQGEDAQDPSA